MKKTLFTLVKILVSLAGLGFIVILFKDRWREVVEVLRRFHPGFFVLALGFFFTGFILITLRFRQLLMVQSVRISLPELFYLNTIGHFFSLFLPSAIGGDVVKAYYTCRRSGKKVASFTSIFLDRFVGSLAIMTLGLGALFYYGGRLNLNPIRNWVLGLLGVMILVGVLLLSRRVGERLQFLSRFVPSGKLKELFAHVYQSLNYYRHHAPVLCRVYVISLAAQILFIGVFYSLACSLGVFVPFFNFFLVIPIIGLLSMAPSINGLGVREAGFVYLMGLFTSAEKALAISLLYDALIYGTGMFFGIVYLGREGFHYEVVHEAMDMEEQVEKMEGLDPSGKDAPSIPEEVRYD